MNEQIEKIKIALTKLSEVYVAVSFRLEKIDQVDLNVAYISVAPRDKVKKVLHFLRDAKLAFRLKYKVVLHNLVASEIINLEDEGTEIVWESEPQWNKLIEDLNVRLQEAEGIYIFKEKLKDFHY